MIIIKTMTVIEKKNKKKKKSRNNNRTNQMIRIIINAFLGFQLSLSFPSL